MIGVSRHPSVKNDPHAILACMNTKNVLIFALIVCLIVVPFVSFAQVPFGGLVTALVPCNSGELLYVLVPPLLVPSTFMWFTGELPFPMYVAPHPGQELLGMAAITPVPCIVGTVSVGSGKPILYHGESL